MEQVGGGLKLATDPVSGTRSAAISVVIPCGSRFEIPEEAGWSHFTEHLLFKGTGSLDSAALDQLFDSLGGEMNALTSRESTVLINRVASERLGDALGAMMQMCFEPSMSPIENERAVILEEMAMIDDEPAEKVFDHLSKAIFGEHPLGRPVIGTAESVSNASEDELKRFHARNYIGREVIVSVAGEFDSDTVREVISPWADRQVSEPPARTTASKPDGGVQSILRECEQTHICLGTTGPGASSGRRFALKVLDQVLGGGASSRLFRTLREDLGLAYDTHSFVAGTWDVSEIGVYVATRPDNAEKAARALGEVVASLASTISEDDVQHARQSLVSRQRLASESSTEHSIRNGLEVLNGRDPMSDSEIENQIAAVTTDEVRDIASEVWALDGLTAVSLGPSDDAAQAALDACGGFVG